MENRSYETRHPFVFENAGQKLFAIFHEPLYQKNCPLVVICHGFGGDKVGRYRSFVTLAEELAKNNIATLRFDFRGAGDSEGLITDLTISSQVADVEAALQFAINHLPIDPNRIGILGKSLGGLISVLAASRFQKTKSLALWAPVYNAMQWRSFQPLVLDSTPFTEEVKKLLQFEGMPVAKEFLKEFLTIETEKNLEKLHSVPLLHIHGEKDTILELAHVENYEKNRNLASALSKFLRLPKSNHDFEVISEREILVNETLKWFIETL